VRKVMFCLILIGCGYFTAVVAADLGELGQVFPIEEPDLLIQMQEHVVSLQKSGELSKKMAVLTTPHPIIVHTADRYHLQPTVSYQKRLFDPTVILDHDLYDGQGRLLARAGSHIDPLALRPLASELLLFDGSDPAELKWVKEYVKTHASVMLILVGGEVQASSEELRRRCYADLNGALTKRFQLSHVPARISQQGKQLLIEELVP